MISFYFNDNVHKRFKTNVISAATPTITASNSATSYEIGGTAVTLTCKSASDSGGSGAYVWKLASNAVYVLLTLLA